MVSGRCYMEECRDLRLNVIQGMELNPSFLLSEQGPAKDAQAQVSCPNIMTASWFQQEKVLTYLSPPYFFDILRNTNSGNR